MSLSDPGRFPHNWLTGKVEKIYLVAPVETARGCFIGWNELEVRDLWDDFEKLLEDSPKNETLQLTTKEPINYHYILNTGDWTEADSWGNFCKKWITKLMARIEDVFKDRPAMLAIISAFDNNRNLPTNDNFFFHLFYKRLVALILLKAASENDIIQARDAYWQLVYMKDPRESEKTIREAISKRNSEAAKKSKRNKDYEMLRKETIKIYSSNTYKSILNAARKIAPKIRQYAIDHNLTKLSQEREIKTIQDWITRYQKNKDK